MRLIQEPMEEGNVEEVERILNTIWFPQLLYKPIRSTYYTVKGNMAMMNQDFDTAEKHLKKSSELGSPMPEAEGANKLQLGMMSLQKGDFKAGESYIRAAIRLGIPDKESEAVAYLSMCQIFMNKREFRAAKDYFRKAKACKPKTKQVIDQVKEIEKYISRIPG
jgi:tetratricopeptide (TPR) repeat protein